MSPPPILSVKDLTVEFPTSGGLFGGGRTAFTAVNSVTLDVQPGEILSIVGESGSGKTTLARTVHGLQRESAGAIILDGKTVSGLSPQKARIARKSIQYLHQDAGAALDPWWSVGRTLNEALIVRGMRARSERQKHIAQIIDAVGLNESFLPRYPHELSGGQQRRVSLARILMMESRLLILDEPTAGLDVSIQSTILQLLLDLRQRFSLTYIFVSHDLSVVRLISDRVCIMCAGKIVESGPAAEIFDNPKDDYTKRLLNSAPRLNLSPP
ncbi:MAG: ABC transporter ATP-binding protein [Pseudorhodoplanes sp.]|uniref:ABC transporter ATP-binding protein n=1 Tax=Pseudorhodoplanes sp. TaxID=1934341 RepID=UPI003D0F3DD1